MLARVARRSLPLGRAAGRNFCAPVVPLVDEVRAELATMKEKVGEKTEVGYTPEAFSAALAAGTVDTSLLSSTMDFSDEARKMVMKLNMEAASMTKEMATPMVADYAAEPKIAASGLDPSIIAKVQAIYSSELEAALKAADGSSEIASLEKEISAMFSGPDGLFELAAKEEKASEAGMLQCIADMEKLEVDVQGVANVTIGEILDREPELRAEIEEEIKNNVWAP
jgi:hypothetical protein